MPEQDQLPESGYRLVQVYAVRQSYSIEEPERQESGESESDADDNGSRPVTVRWDWRYVPETIDDEEPHIEVMLSIEVEPVEGSPDRIQVDQVGRFEVVQMDRPVEIKAFVATAGPAMLVPYIRQKLSALSEAGPYDTYHLPTLNVRALMDQMNFEATTGWDQLQEDEEATEDESEPVETSNEESS